jgi:hypothetical protein
MRKAAALGLFALGTLGMMQTRAADYQAAASLERAVPATTDTEIDGVNWRCTGDKCVATPVGRKSPGSGMAECRRWPQPSAGLPASPVAAKSSANAIWTPAIAARADRSTELQPIPD